MKIVYLITGSGGSFYCGNCYRDALYVKAIRKVPGIEAEAVPLYLPPDGESADENFDKSVFFGAISMYLREKVPFMKNMPALFDKLFDMTPLLKLAAKRAGTTRTEGLEEMTLNMIEGENAFRAQEVDRLVKYISRDKKPDVIHLSNALIIGLARQLKKRLDVKVVCSLLNEDDWIEEMAEPWKSKAWKMIAREAGNVDAFVTPSKYYKDFFIGKTSINGEKISIVPLGFSNDNPHQPVQENRSKAIGYFSRVNYHNGFDKITDAFIRISNKNIFPGLTLNVCGGYTADDKPFLQEQIAKIRAAGLGKNVKIFPEFSGNKKLEFFESVDLISVPVNKYDGFGLYLLEANSSGVPVVQPDTGAFPEIVEKTGGGIIYSPDTSDALADALISVLADDILRKNLSENGKKNVSKYFTREEMAKGLEAIYKDNSA